jgi:hypothetical protein
MRLFNEPQRGPRRVRVPGRDDVGEVINEGTNIGAADKNIYCVAVHFPLTGEVVYYDKDRVTNLED